MHNIHPTKEAPHVNQFYPWREGVFTTCVSWVETKPTMGQRRVHYKIRPSDGEQTSPNIGGYFDLVIAYVDKYGMVQFHEIDFNERSLAEIADIPKYFKLDTYQSERVQYAVQNQTVLPAWLVNKANNNRHRHRPSRSANAKALREQATRNWPKIAAELIEYAKTSENGFKDKHMQQLRDIAFHSPTDMPGNIQPWYLDSHHFNRHNLKGYAKQPKTDNMPVNMVEGLVAEGSYTREVAQARYDERYAQWMAQMEERRQKNAAWHLAETERRAANPDSTTNIDTNSNIDFQEE